MFAASPEEKRVVDAINKQKDEIKKQEVDVKNLVDRIAAEIERVYKCTEEPGRQETVQTLVLNHSRVVGNTTDAKFAPSRKKVN